MSGDLIRPAWPWYAATPVSSSVCAVLTNVTLSRVDPLKSNFGAGLAFDPIT
jgi:hypothetical protein